MVHTFTDPDCDTIYSYLAEDLRVEIEQVRGRNRDLTDPIAPGEHVYHTAEMLEEQLVRYCNTVSRTFGFSSYIEERRRFGSNVIFDVYAISPQGGRMRYVSILVDPFDEQVHERWHSSQFERLLKR